MGWWEGSTPLCRRLSLRVGVYGHFAPLDWSQVFSGPEPGRPAHGSMRLKRQNTH